MRHKTEEEEVSHSRQSKGTSRQGVLQKEYILMTNFQEQGSQERRAHNDDSQLTGNTGQNTLYIDRTNETHMEHN